MEPVVQALWSVLDKWPTELLNIVAAYDPDDNSRPRLVTDTRHVPFQQQISCVMFRGPIVFLNYVADKRMVWTKTHSAWSNLFDRVRDQLKRNQNDFVFGPVHNEIKTVFYLSKQASTLIHMPRNTSLMVWVYLENLVHHNLLAHILAWREMPRKVKRMKTCRIFH